MRSVFWTDSLMAGIRVGQGRSLPFTEELTRTGTIPALTHAVIPAAGMGTRFLPATKALPKEMLPLVDKPTIQYVVEEALGAGLENILVITGRGKRAIEDHFDLAFELEDALRVQGKDALVQSTRRLGELIDLHYVRQKVPRGLGHAVYCARLHVGEAPFAVLLGDDVLVGEGAGIAQLKARYELTGDPVVGVTEVAADEVEQYGIIEGERVGPGLFRVRDLVEKPAPEAAPSRFAIVGRYVLTPEIFGILERQEPGARGEIQLTDGLRTLCRRRPLWAVELGGTRFDVGQPLGWLRANVEMAMDREELRSGMMELIAGWARGARR